MLLSPNKFGKLNKPSWRALGNGPHYPSAVRSAHQLSKSIKLRVICFLAAETLDTLTPGKSQVWCHRSAPMKFIYKSCFADSGFACDKDDLPVTARGGFQTAVQNRDGVFPADKSGIRCGTKQGS